MKKNSQFLLAALLSAAATTSYSSLERKVQKEFAPGSIQDVIDRSFVGIIGRGAPSSAPAASTHSAPATLATTPAPVAPSSAPTTLPAVAPAKPTLPGLEAATAATPGDQKRDAEELDPTPILSGLLAQAKQLLTPLNLPAELPVAKGEMVALITQGKSTLAHLTHDNEFTKAYMKDADALMAKLIALAPQAQSLWNRGAEFLVHAKTMPAATEFADNVGTTFAKCQAFQRNLQVAQAFRLMEFFSPNDPSNAQFAQALADQAKAAKEAQEKREKEVKEMMDELKAQTDQVTEALKSLHSMVKPAPKGNNASSK